MAPAGRLDQRRGELLDLTALEGERARILWVSDEQLQYRRKPGRIHVTRAIDHRVARDVEQPFKLPTRGCRGLEALREQAREKSDTLDAPTEERETPRVI